jgi:hypothetical protein
MKIVKVKLDKKTKQHYLPLKSFKDLVDIKQVASYTLEPIHDGTNIALILTFFDSDGAVLSAKGDE